MKYLGIILGVVVLAFAGLFAVYKFGAGKKPAPPASPAQQAQQTGAINRPAPSNDAAQILQGSAAVIGAIGGLSSFFGGARAEVSI